MSTRALLSVEPRLKAKFRDALGVLLDAWLYAEDTGSSLWDFAVEISLLRDAGLKSCDLRWLIRKGYVEHRVETTHLEDNGRQFQATGDLSFSTRTCFVLTESGLGFATSHAFIGPGSNGANRNGSNGKPRPQEVESPKWDTARHELRVGIQVVKRFKWPANNQQTILAAFEEEGWPSRIDDPLPPHPEQDSKRRLHDTIKSLNKNQKVHCLRFRGDGTGQGVLWELIRNGDAVSRNGDGE